MTMERVEEAVLRGLGLKAALRFYKQKLIGVSPVDPFCGKWDTRLN